MKLGIGTAQFGLNYGISNVYGKISFEEAKKILMLANEINGKIIDTAPNYGTSEEIIGQVLLSAHNFKIITKTPILSKTTINSEDINHVEKTFYRSLSRLNQKSIYGLLVHEVNDLFSNNSNILFAKLQELKELGLIKKIGISAYTSDGIDKVLDKYKIDLIQIPINILDQRLIKSGHLKILKQEGIEIHARSIFLQGLLLTNPDNLPPYFNSVKTHLKKYNKEISKRNISLLQAAINFIMKLDEIDGIICGVNSSKELNEIYNESKSNLNYDFSRFAISDENILNPSKWRL